MYFTVVTIKVPRFLLNFIAPGVWALDRNSRRMHDSLMIFQVVLVLLEFAAYITWNSVSLWTVHINDMKAHSSFRAHLWAMWAFFNVCSLLMHASIVSLVFFEG